MRTPCILVLTLTLGACGSAGDSGDSAGANGGSAGRSSVGAGGSLAGNASGAPSSSGAATAGATGNDGAASGGSSAGGALAGGAGGVSQLSGGTAGVDPAGGAAGGGAPAAAGTAGAAAGVGGGAGSGGTTSEPDPACVEMVEAATAFLQSLDAANRTAASLSWQGAPRLSFEFLPPNQAARQGLTLKGLGAAQRLAFENFLRKAMSSSGYTKTERIRQLEVALGTPPVRDPDNYFVSFFGEPTAAGTTAWGWRSKATTCPFIRA